MRPAFLLLCFLLAQMETRAAGKFTVAIDIGHTPAAPGARSARGVWEYEFNKRICAQLHDTLRRAGIASFIINPSEKEIALGERARVANTRKADLFIAIHHDSVNDRYLQPWDFNGRQELFCDKFRGYSIFHSDKN